MSKTVFFYVQDWVPARNGSGSAIRIWTNLRAYSDLGFRVRGVYVASRPIQHFAPDPLPAVSWRCLEPSKATPAMVLGRLAYHIGWPLPLALDYHFKTRRVLQAALRENLADPSAIHHFEYVKTANALIGMPRLRSVWSHHDLESRFFTTHARLRREIDSSRTPPGWVRRSARCIERAERKAAESARLVLTIARHERDYIRSRWHCPHVELLPMTFPDEIRLRRERDFVEGRILRLLHVGRIDSLPSFGSLSVLLRDVLPGLPGGLRDRIRLDIVGEVRDSEKARRLRELAKRLPNVHFHGFVEDLRPFYRTADLQVVASTEATGLRTRIVESMNYGLPVLSTRTGAAGLEGLVAGENILLADRPTEIMGCLERVAQEPRLLEKISDGGHALYEETHSRASVTQRLGAYLERYLGVEP